jgi:protein-tyrosine phosphatase
MFLEKRDIMIDIHTHILPGLDDGAQSLEESLLLAKAAVEDGIHTLIATPHHANGKYTNSASVVRDNVSQLNEELIRSNIPLVVLNGQEIRLTTQLLEEWEAGELLCLHDSSYMLLELPSGHIPAETASFIYELSLFKIQPIIAHPERNAAIAGNPDLLQQLVEIGALAQVTSHSLNGFFGSKVQQLSLQLCKRNLVHFIATDAHHWQYRGFDLSQAYSLLEQELGVEATEYYKANAESIVSNSPIHILEPQKTRRKWFRLW